MNSIARMLLILPIAVMAGCQTNSETDQNIKSSWEDKYDSESVNERRFNEICQTLPKAWVLEVNGLERERALEQLASKPWRELSLEETKALTTIMLDTDAYPPKTQETLAGNLLWQAVENARKQTESRGFIFCKNSSGQECADYLSQIGLQGASRGRTPFLIRSARKNPGTGRYDVEECESGVVVTHSSLSRHSSEPENNPLIVFLKRPPQSVIKYTSVAE